ncbi:MAG: methylamine methyltransferase corrinoid protein reductive activase [Dehalococcoidales bacterium]
MGKLGIALDLGTSGFRGQAIDLDNGNKIISTAITTRHPLPGANVIDHLHFALEVGLEISHDVVIHAVNRVIDNLRIEKNDVIRAAVCGNPIQLSLFREIEIRDLAYAGKRKLEALGVVPPKRDAQIFKAQDIRGLNLSAGVDILVPPAVRHEIGADALAMMIQAGALDRGEIAIVTDYGTNNEMSLIVGGVVYTGSTAAGPALEGQQIEDGLLALPGAISDVEYYFPDASSPGGGLQCFVLDQDMFVQKGDKVVPSSGRVLDKGDLEAVGITGTGVVALLSQGLKAGLIKLPKIDTGDSEIKLASGVKFTEHDVKEAGKAIGAVRAGHVALCQAAGIDLSQIETAYMSGASGTYVDALKAQQIGMIPSGVKRIFQVGNTSLAMSRDMVKSVDELWNMQKMANELRQNHCMFAESEVFKQVYLLELSYWTEGMPMKMYQQFLKKYGLPPLNEASELPQVIKTVERDIPDLGVMGLKIIPDIGELKRIIFEGCIGCEKCTEECPEDALSQDEQEDGFGIIIDLALCDGMGCSRCERACDEKVFNLNKLLTSGIKVR